jgi:hypothetical protein
MLPPGTKPRHPEEKTSQTMKLHRFSDVPEEARPPMLDQLRLQLDRLVTPVQVLERDFDVPGRGKQSAVAVNASGELVLIELARIELERLPEDLTGRLAWFEENRRILPRLFPDSGLDPSRDFHVILLAPGFGATFGNTTAACAAARIQLVRFRLIQSPTAGVGFLLERPGFDSTTAWPRSRHFGAGSAVSEILVSEQPAPETPAPDTRTSERDPLLTGPGRTLDPGEILARAKHWILRLSSGIESGVEADATRFLFRGEVVAVLTLQSDHLEIAVPGSDSTRARDVHELNRGMDHVIKRYFTLVDPEARPRIQLTRDDILTEGELAAFFDSEPDAPG